MKCLKALLPKFPDQADKLKRLFEQSPSFQSLCDDHMRCAEALRYWQQSVADDPTVIEGSTWGMSGALDHYGTLNYPYGPMTVSKSFMATASTWAGVEAALESLTNNTVMAGESKLWGMERNGTVNLWTYAKCINLSLGERADGNSPPFSGSAVFGMEVSIEFFCRTGEWYAENEEATAYTPLFSVNLLDVDNNIMEPPFNQGGTISNVISVSWEERLDESGAVSFTVPR